MAQRLTAFPVSVGIDWITATQKYESDAEPLSTFAYALAEVEMARGETGSPFRAMGYEGFKCGAVAYGERHDGRFLQISGGVADSHWQRVYEACDSVTRMDWQVTCRVGEDPKRTIKRHYAQLLKHRARFKKAPRVLLNAENAEAFTVYSGKPQSDRYGRIYDKWRESGLDYYNHCVRYEMVLREKRAKLGAFQLAHRRQSKTWVASHVLGFFADRGAGLRMLMKSLGDLAFLNDLKLPTRPSSTDRQLEWIRTSVSPTVLSLVERIGLQETLQALGLADSCYSP